MRLWTAHPDSGEACYDDSGEQRRALDKIIRPIGEFALRMLSHFEMLEINERVALKAHCAKLERAINSLTSPHGIVFNNPKNISSIYIEYDPIGTKMEIHYREENGCL